MSTIDVSTYRPTDDFFGAPYVDLDEVRPLPQEHRHLHGGFEGTDTRFSLYFPPAGQYRGRMYQPLEGANAGTEHMMTGPLASVYGGMDMGFRLGGYVVESNMGHIGDVMDPKAGPDPSLYGWRAAAETARFSKHLAAQIYGAAPTYSYVFGGSGGARRSPLCLAYAPGVWDAAMPFMGDNVDGDYGDFRRVRNGAPNFSCMFNVQRILGPKINDVVDAMWPGGSGDPFTGLNTHQRDELASLYRLGYPRGDEFSIAEPMGQMWLWTSMADRLQREDAAYFEAFWTKPGYVGHDQPDLLTHDIIDERTTVKRLLSANHLLSEAEFQGPEYSGLRNFAMLLGGKPELADMALAVQLDTKTSGYVLGAGVRFLNGQGKGRQLYALQAVGTVLLCGGEGEAGNLRFNGVLPGDDVHFDNRAFLAYCYYYRHHIHDSVEYDFLRVDGRPIYDQHEELEMSPFMGTCHTGQYQGKLMWVHHTHDASLWPAMGVGMRNNVLRECGAEEMDRKFRLRWTDNAEHITPALAPSHPRRHNTTWLINFQPVVEQCLVDLAAWVERDVAPEGTNFELRDGQIVLPDTAAARGGIQPVVSVTANGSVRAEVAVGEPVSLQVHAEVPAGAGKIIAAKWDFDGSGAYPETVPVDGASSQETLTTMHTFDRPGTYFATCLVESHRDGDLNARTCRIPNLASARIVVE
jgi:hypothetical protein